MVWMGPDNPQDSFGPSFRPNGRFSTHFGPNLMFLAPTGTLVSQDLGLAWLWTSRIAAGKPDPLFETSASVLSQQQTWLAQSGNPSEEVKDDSTMSPARQDTRSKRSQMSPFNSENNSNSPLAGAASKLQRTSTQETNTK